LTKLGNRRLLVDRLKQALAVSTRTGDRGALLFIDLDNFKRLNDTAGHDIGDMLLQHVAQRLNTCVRDGDTVARLGGDEFVVVLSNLGPLDEPAALLAEHVASASSARSMRPMTWLGRLTSAVQHWCCVVRRRT